MRSLGAWALPWLLIVAVLVIALVVVFDMVGNDPIRTGAEGQETQASVDNEEGEPKAAPTEEPQAEVETKAESNDNSVEADKNGPPDKPAKEADEPKLITNGIQVQVLNGTADPNVDDLMADRLARLGYSVVAVSPSSTGYPKTVVFWTEDAQKVAAPLAERFEWRSDAAPSNLSSEVQLHVVVGEDAL